MALQFGKKSSSKARPSYVYAIIGVSMVLFMLGLLGIVVINAKKLSDYFKENIEISVILMDNVTPEQVAFIQQKLGEKPYIKSMEYVSKDMALQRFRQNFQEDFMEMLEYNPLYASINFHLNSEYANGDSIRLIENFLMANKNIREVYYQKKLVEVMNQNAKRISLILIVIIVVLFFIALALIDNTIKLVMYSNRFLIKSMQMVGATRWFISKPLIGRAALNGFISGLIASCLLFALGVYACNLLPELRTLISLYLFVALLSGVILIGILISMWSTFWSVRKYLKLHLDELY